MKKILTLLLCFSVILTACGGSVPGSEKLNVKSEEIQFAQPQPGDTVAEITTDAGVIKVLLFPEIAPKAVNNFIMLAQNGYYNGITFHRAIEDMLIQSGSFDGTAAGGKSIWELEFEDEFSDQLHHYNGALSMCYVVVTWIKSGMMIHAREMSEIYDYIIRRSMEDVLGEM